MFQTEPNLRRISTRQIVFGVALALLTFVLYRQTVRREFWHQRQVSYKSTYEISGPGLSAEMVERISPVAVRVVFFFPAEQAVKVYAFLETKGGRQQDGSSIRIIRTNTNPGRTQLTCSLFLGERSSLGEWNGIWRGLGGTEIVPDLRHVGIWLNGRDREWRIAPRLHAGLTRESPDRFCLPLFVNDMGDTVGLAIVRMKDNPR